MLRADTGFQNGGGVSPVTVKYSIKMHSRAYERYFFPFLRKCTVVKKVVRNHSFFHDNHFSEKMVMRCDRVVRKLSKGCQRGVFLDHLCLMLSKGCQRGVIRPFISHDEHFT